ncbi:hypothetical protein HNP93_001387 [Methanococcus maripaludis]|uniref:PEGA domain-containing protein n=1 Tax=Methanococcus maripaludis TaxID=39152 RepID=A0A7J9P7J3_METMI|nr:hypothetical protein [Methanococcus maripaludis]MBA2858686.1 hypothetical protein [Methanococcus maripaludis]
MIKRYFLFLLLLCCAVGSVNALSTDIQGTDGTSEYYMVLTDNYSDELIDSSLTSADWLAYAPVVVGYGNNKVYFASKNDLARACNIFQDSNAHCLFDGNFITYVDGKWVPCTVVTGNGGVPVYLTSGPQNYYVYGEVFSTVSSGETSITLDGSSYWVACSGSGGHNSKYAVVPADETITYSGVVSVVDGVLRGSIQLGIVVFDYMEVTSYTDRVTVLVTPPDLGNVSIYTEPETGIYENEGLLGTTDNGGFLELQLPFGEHNLKFVKEGYWEAYKSVNINVENETELFASLSPKTSIFQVSKEFSGNLYPNSVGTLSMDVTPVKDAYAAKLRVSGVEVNKVYYKTQELPKGSDGYYILGDVTGTQNIEIEFETPSSWGEKTFTVELSATDIEGTAYTNLETINYEVLELPFLLEMPETFGIGINDITLTDQSGTAYSVLMVLYDSDDVEVWSSSTNLLEYCDYTFEVPIDDAGDYTLELNAKSGTVKIYYSVEIIEPVTLITDEITANPGKVATVQFKISNPTSNVKYYTAELTCPFFNESINKTFSIAPETVDKTVDMSFEVPEGLELENYQLSLEIFDPDKTEPIYSGNVVLTISNESIIFASVPGGNTTLVLLAAAILLIGGTFAALRLKK